MRTRAGSHRSGRPIGAAVRSAAVLASAVALAALAACSGTRTIPLADGTAGAAAGPRPTTGPHARHEPQSNAVPSTPSQVPGTPDPVRLATDSPRQSPGVVAAGQDAPYNYAPSVLFQGGTYRMWWCSQLPGAPRPGDEILYGESASPDGPFTAPGGGPPLVVFGNSVGGFDALHTCDPSVIAVGGTYFLYYTGTADPAGNNNAIGLATSTDGIHWTRANNGAPVVPASGEVPRANAYGAGQPSALYRDGWYYLMFTDTTGHDAGPSGNGQFVLRSTDPAFGANVQALTPGGFQPVPSSRAQRLRPVLAGYTADWMWVDALNAYALAMDTAAGTSVTFWDPTFTYQPYDPLTIGGAQMEGPGLVRRADGHAPIDPADPCGRVRFDVERATMGGAGPNGISHFGLDVHGLDACHTPALAADVLNGFAVPSPDRTTDLVIGGHLVEIERRSVAQAIAVGVLDAAPPGVAGLAVVAALKSGADAVIAPGRPLGMLLSDRKLWPVGPQPLAALNSSTVTTVSPEQYDTYAKGTDLTALRP